MDIDVRIQLDFSPQQKRIVRGALVTSAVIGALGIGIGVAVAAPQTFAGGEKLTSAKMNANFADVATPPGTIVAFGGDTAPAGWLLCNGQAVSRTSNVALFNALSVRYGAGDGTSTFNLPDLRGRTTFGAGTGTGLAPRALADKLGEESHTLTLNELPAHSHSLARGPGFTTGEDSNPSCGCNPGGYNGRVLIDITSQNTSNAGAGASHNVMPPGVVLNFIVKG